MMKYIKVSHKLALVDDDDYARVTAHNWWLLKAGYAYTQKSMKGKRTTTLIHRLIMNPPKGMEVDHINGDKLDNRKQNLRLCTRSENNMNRKHTGVYRGIRWTKNGWQAEIKTNRVYKYLGRFKDPIQAAMAYDKAAKKQHGSFARLNFKDSDLGV